MIRRACRCGHPYDAHQHYSRSNRCALCDWCIVYQPRRWWRRATHKPPAPESGLPPGRATADPPPRPLAPGHHSGGLDMTIRLWRCGCIHFFGRDGALLDAAPCHQEQRGGDMWDDWLKGLTS